MNKIDEKIIANIRVVTQEMITGAKSGHPGIALGAAPIMHALYSRVLKITSKNSKWYNRDRFVLAAGHGSSLLYTMLHLYGYKVSVEDLKSFRKINSLTPGHPEYGHTDGVDATSGPLGQGIPMAVGMALSELFLEAKYNKEDITLFNNYTYVLCGDGDLQEGVTCEALSLAGNLKLNKLIILYDSNDIQLDGKVADCNTESTQKKVEAMNINYLRVDDGENIDDIVNKIELAKKSDKPTLIEIKTIIGKTSSLENTCAIHGSPLPLEEVIKMREAIGGKPFEFTPEVYECYKRKCEENNLVYLQEEKVLKEYAEKYKADYLELNLFYNGNDQITKNDFMLNFDETYSKATRNAAGEVMNSLTSMCPIIIGGSADLSKSTCIKGADGNYNYTTRTGRNILFGVREHAMAAICNGISLNGITKSFCGGFFVFSDYMKPAIRMSALMHLPVMYFFTHDSIAVGEDGPTHEPIEQLTMLRSIPNLNVIRPCGREEVKEAITIAYNSKDNPTAIILSRQGLLESRTKENSQENLSLKGAYIISKEQKNLDAVIIASGSEVPLAISAQKVLLNEGIDIRIVSMPSMFLFDKMDSDYKETIVPTKVKKIAIEMSEAAHMYKYVKDGEVINIKTFGLSGKASDVLDSFGFTTEKIVQKIKEIINK